MKGQFRQVLLYVLQAEENERTRIENEKETERRKATEDLENWKEEQRQKAEQVTERNEISQFMRLWYSKTCIKGPIKRRPKIYFQDRLSLAAGQKYCRMLQESILQYF